MKLACIVLLVFSTCAYAAADQKSPELSDLVGDWSGTSLCQVKPSACHDENVVYHLSNPHDDKITIQADKIVDGKPINMGAGDWTYQKSARSLTFEIPRGMWKLVVTGDTMDGTLTDPDGTIFRKVHLSRSK
jgi:hypothetical protein